MYRYQLEHFIQTGERPEVVLPADGLLWTNASGFSRLWSMRYYYGDQFPEYVTTIRGWEGRAGIGQYTTGPDDFWFSDETLALLWLENDFLPRLRRERYCDEWDVKQYILLPRQPEVEHRKGFPSFIERARFIVGLPPTARLKPPFQSSLDTVPPTDLIDPVTTLVPVFLVLRRRGEEA